MLRRLTFDRDRCLACRSCELACAVVHSASGALLPAIDERPAPPRRVAIAAGPRGIAALRCSQCDEPLCVFSCKSGALYRLSDGGVEFDESRCVGCLMCFMVCPFIRRRSAFAAVHHEAASARQPSPGQTEAKAGAVHFESEVPVRCDVCAGRERPACVSACPTKALGIAPPALAPAVAGAGTSAGKPAPPARPFTGHLVVVGSSAAGIAACEAARELAPNCRITMITADAEWYSRPLLPYVLGGRIEQKQVEWRAKEYLTGLGVDVITGASAIELKADKKIVVVRPAEEISFDRLVIATGARATRLTVPGSDLEGVHVLRDLSDLHAIAKIFADAGAAGGREPRRRCVVVGGGNVGLQTAEALARRGAHVTVVVKSAHLLSQMVDAEAGRRVGELFARNGVEVRTGLDVAEIAPFDSPESRAPLAQGFASPASSSRLARASVGRVRLACAERRSSFDKLGTNGVEGDDGEWIDADLVIVGKGIQPNVEWLRPSGIRIGRGILVDRNGRTNLQGVFAAGDCAEIKDPVTAKSAVSGVWPIAYEMGRAAGAAAVGADRASAGALRMNSSKFFGTTVISIGEVRAERVPGSTAHVVEAGDAAYRKLVMKDGRLIGAVLYGDVSDAGLYYRLYRDGTALEDAAAEDIERTRVRWIAALAEQMSA